MWDSDAFFYGAVPCGTRLGVKEHIWGWTFGTPVDIYPMPRTLGLCRRYVPTNTPAGRYGSEMRKITINWWTGRIQTQHLERKGDSNWCETTEITGTSWRSCWKSVRVHVFGKRHLWNWWNWRGHNIHYKDHWGDDSMITLCTSRFCGIFKMKIVAKAANGMI